MLPLTFQLFGPQLTSWDVALLTGVAVGYCVFLRALHAGQLSIAPRLVALRWLFLVYVSVLGAQLFAYAFDLNESLFPPHGVTWLRYYFHPFQGAKTLYGAILVLPLSMLLVTLPWRGLSYRHGLERVTPAMMATLACVRLGCFLQGCCYGVRSDWLGLSFRPGSPVQNRQAYEGLIAAGASSLPVVPTQLFSAVVLAFLAAWSFQRVNRGHPHVFVHSVAAYSAWRFVIEFARADPDRNQYGALSTSQWIAACLLVMYGTWALARSHRRLEPEAARSRFPV